MKGEMEGTDKRGTPAQGEETIVSVRLLFLPREEVFTNWRSLGCRQNILVAIIPTRHSTVIFQLTERSL